MLQIYINSHSLKYTSANNIFAFISIINLVLLVIVSAIYLSICDTNNDWKPDLVRYVEMPQVTLGPLVWGDGEVSLELGSETVCRRVRFEGGLNRGLLGLFTSLLSSFCRGEEITQLQGLHWPNDFYTLIPAAENKTSSTRNMETAIMI